MKFKFVGEDYGDAISSGRFSKVLEKWMQSSEAYAIQKVFVYDHVAEFFNSFEKRYLEKIVKDINYILTKGWALEISKDDFYHGHICGKSKNVTEDLDILLSASNVCFLYHTFEGQPIHPKAINRSILSFPDALPKPVYPKYKFQSRPYYSVDPRDLGLMEYARIFFKRDIKAPYQIRDGNKLEIWGKFP